MKTTLKIAGVGLALYVVLLFVGISIAKSASSFTPTPRAVSAAYFKNQVPEAKAGGAILKNVTCKATRWWHIFQCDITFVPVGQSANVCISQYIHTAGHKIKGRLFHEWFPVWACRTRPTTVPKPYPGDAGPPGA